MNVAILGSGFIVPYFIEYASKIKGYHIKALWGRHKEKIEQFKEKCDYVTDKIDDILNDKTIDLVYIALPNGVHYEYAKKCLLANKNILVEKPFCTTYQQAKEIFELAKQRNLFAYEAIMTLHLPGYQFVKENYQKIGDIKIIEANFSQFSRRYLKFKNNEILPAFDVSLAGGALMDLGIYNIHFICGLFGEPNNVIYYPNLEKGVDTSGILILEYQNFKAVLTNSKDTQAPSHVFIQGVNGLIKVNSTSSRCSNISLIQNNEETKIYESEDAEIGGMYYELNEFLRIFQNKDVISCEKANNATLLAIKVLEKAYHYCEI